MTFHRRNFLKALTTIGIASTVTSSHAATELLRNDEKFQFLCEPYLQNFTKESITICALVNKPSLTWLEMIDANNNVIETIYQTEDGMRNANTDFFKFIVNHQGKNFHYRIVSKEVTRFEAYKIQYGEEIVSTIIKTKLPFKKTDDETNVIILNDIHENSTSYQALLNKKAIHDSDLVFLNGDLFNYVSKQEDLSSKLLAPTSLLFASETPFIMVRGNHETRGSFARQYKQYFDYPENKFYQAFSLGGVFWIVLDGGEDKPDNHEVYAGTVDYDNYRLEQKKWLTDILNSKECKKAKHKIVVNHIPWFHSDDWHGTLHTRACFHDLLQKHKVDALISGHTHTYGFYPPDQDHNYHVIIGGGPKEGNRTLIEVNTHKNNLSIILRHEKGNIINRYQKG